MKKMLYVALIFCIVLCSIGIYGYSSMYSPSVKKETVFSVPAGSSVKSIAQALYKENLIPSPLFFELIARMDNASRKVRSGEYLLEVDSTPAQIVNLFVSGTMRMIRTTIPEGLPWWEVAKRFEAVGLVTFVDFSALMYDAQFLQEQGLPYSSAEGFLYPETYTFVKPAVADINTTKDVIATMIRTFYAQTKGIFPSSYSKEEEYKTIILASIVEKEAQQIEERARIAGVYLNRIAVNMILQADPTTIYGLGANFDGNLRKKDLQDATNPYNTYRIVGLPPTPICSPSKGVLEAVRNPEQHEYIYFVATKKEGRHFFSKTLPEHNRAVQKYQIEQ